MPTENSGCQKQMLNGPCGGVHEGLCELSGECAWVKAFYALKKAGRLDDFMKVKVPKR